MKSFACFTAIVFTILGVLVLLLGAFIMMSGSLSQATSQPAVPSLIPDFSGLFMLAGLIAGGVVCLQGFFLAAIGQVLWLLAAIAEEAEFDKRIHVCSSPAS